MTKYQIQRTDSATNNQFWKSFLEEIEQFQIFAQSKDFEGLYQVTNRPLCHPLLCLTPLHP
jgi:hypothetical protein